jgi:hypothetical protein
VVRTYADEGKSGLRLDGRDALKRLIEDVQSGKAGFTTILVYDVSRWGASRTPTKAPTTNTSAGAPVLPSKIAPSSSRMVAARSRLPARCDGRSVSTLAYRPT